MIPVYSPVDQTLLRVPFRGLQPWAYTDNLVYALFVIPCRDSNLGHFELQSKSHDELDRSAIAPLEIHFVLTGVTA